MNIKDVLKQNIEYTEKKVYRDDMLESYQIALLNNQIVIMKALKELLDEKDKPKSGKA